MSEKINNYDNIETIAVNVVKILLKGNVPIEDIMHLSGKTKEEIIKIKEFENSKEKEKGKSEIINGD